MSRNLEQQRQSRSAFLKEYPQRVILLSDTLEMPTLENLLNYLSHFYETLPPALREQFSFEDLAGIYTEGERVRLFAVCTRYAELEGLKTLPEGRYLCAHCTEETRRKALEDAAPGPGGVWGRAILYRAAHCRVGNFTVEL